MTGRLLSTSDRHSSVSHVAIPQWYPKAASPQISHAISFSPSDSRVFSGALVRYECIASSPGVVGTSSFTTGGS